MSFVFDAHLNPKRLHVHTSHAASSLPQENAISCCGVETHKQKTTLSCGYTSVTTLLRGSQLLEKTSASHGLNAATGWTPTRKDFRFTRAESCDWLDPESNVATHVCRERAIHCSSIVVSSNLLPSLNMCAASTAGQVLEIHSYSLHERGLSSISPPFFQAQHCPEMWDLPCQLPKHKIWSLLAPGHSWFAL